MALKLAKFTGSGAAAVMVYVLEPVLLAGVGSESGVVVPGGLEISRLNDTVDVVLFCAFTSKVSYSAKPSGRLAVELPTICGCAPLKS